MNQRVSPWQEVFERLDKLEARQTRLTTIIVSPLAVCLLLAFLNYAFAQGKPAAPTRETSTVTKFAHTRPAAISSLDWALLQTQLMAFENRLRDYAPIGVPRYYYDNAEKRLKAGIHVKADFLKSNSLAQVREKLEVASIQALNDLMITLPNQVEARDVVVEFTTWQSDKPPYVHPVATYRDGTLTMR